jgi:tyrosyl-tRNA synthetase
VQEANFQALYKEVGRVWKNAATYGERHGYNAKPTWKKSLLDNADWLLKLNVVSFLQMLGSGMRVGTMLGRDTYVSPYAASAHFCVLPMLTYCFQS